MKIMAIVFLALLSRLLVVRRTHTTFDAYGHLYFAKEVQAQKAGPFGAIVTKVVGSTGFSQPFLWHWLVGVASIENLLRFQKWINATIDAVFAIMVYLIVLRIGLVDEETAFFMTALYLLTPMWFSVLSNGPRISSLTPRLSSELATNTFFVVTLLPLGMPIGLVLLCGSVLSAFVVLSSKFGLQALLFLVPLTSLFTRDPVPMTAVVFGLVIAVCLTKGGFLNTVGAQIKHLSWYFTKNLKGEVPISRRNSLQKLFEKPKNGGGNLRYIGEVLYRMTVLNSYTSVLIKMPVLPVALVLYASTAMNGTGQLGSYIVGPVLAAVIVFVIINMPPMLFLGEAERYLNHVAVFVVAMATKIAIDQSLSWLLWVILGYGASYWVIEILFLRKLLPKSSSSREDADDHIITHLKSLDHSTVVLGYPYAAGGGVFRIMLETQHRVIYCYATDEEFVARFEREYGADYPYVDLDRLDEMANEYGVTYVIAYKKALTSRGLAQWAPSIQWRKLDCGEPSYEVYQRVSGI